MMEHFKYIAPRGIKLASPTSELVLRRDEEFYVLKTARSLYITHDKVKARPRFKVTLVQLTKLISKSTRLPDVASDGSIEIRHGAGQAKPPVVVKRAPDEAELLRRVDTASVFLGDHKLPPVKPHFRPKAAAKFFETNKGRFRTAFKNSLSKVLSGRPDFSAHNLKDTSTASVIKMSAEITLAGSKYAHLEYKVSVDHMGYVVLTASASVEADQPKPELVYRSQVVKDFYRTFLSLGARMAKTFDVPRGTTIGPLSLKSNLVAPYMAWTRYLVTRL